MLIMQKQQLVFIRITVIILMVSIKPSTVACSIMPSESKKVIHQNFQQYSMHLATAM
jgi:hypothetical protein